MFSFFFTHTFKVMHKIMDVSLARFSICRSFRILSSADFFQSVFTQLFCRKSLNRSSFVLCILSDYLDTALNQTWKANTVRQEFHQKLSLTSIQRLLMTIVNTLYHCGEGEAKAKFRMGN